MSKAMLATTKGTNLIARARNNTSKKWDKKEEQHKQEMGQTGRNNA